MHVGNIFAADGFFWWIGVVENRDDPLKLGRCKVRVLGYHTENTEVLPWHDLPWAVPMQPITSAATSGKGQSPLGPLPGTWVIGFFADGKDCQQPIMMGTIAAQPDGAGTRGGGCGDNNPNQAKDANGNPITDENGNPVATNPGGTIGNLSEEETNALREAIGKRESGGSYSITNQLGYVGKYQFGASALQTVGMVSGAKSNSALSGNVWTGKYGCNSLEDWKANKNGCQDQAMNDLLKSNYSTLNRIGVLNANSSKQDVAGYLTTSHLLGAGGARDLKNGVSGKDANGTTGASYYALGSKAIGASGSSPTGPAPGVNTTASGDGKDPAGALNDPSAGETAGFGDPDGAYPSCNYSGSPDTNKLSQGGVEGTKGTIVEERNKNLTEKIPTAARQFSPVKGGGPWNEPKPAYNSQYPYNQVTEYEGGHVVEYDSTPGNERMNWHHKAGTYEEIDATGTRRTKVVGENYEIVIRDNKIYVKGASDTTVGGAWSLLVQDVAAVEVLGKTSVILRSDATVTVGGTANITVKEDANISAKNINMTSEQDINIKAGKNLNIQAGAMANIQAGASMKLNGAIMSLDAGNVSINSGGMLGGIAGALGGGALTGALGSAVQGVTGLSGLSNLAGVADLTKLGDLSSLGLDKLTSVAGFDLGKLGDMAGLGNLTSLGDLSKINIGGLNMSNIGSLTGLDLGSIGKLAGAAGLNIPGLDQISKLSGASLTSALSGDLGKALGNLNLSSFDGFNLSKLGSLAGVDVTKLTSLVGIKDLANISNLSNIGNSLGLGNVLNSANLEGLNIGSLKLPSFDLGNITSFSPQALLGGTDFLNKAVANGTFNIADITKGTNLVNAATKNLSTALGPQLGNIVNNFVGGANINPATLVNQVTQGLTGGQGVGNIVTSLLGSSGANVQGVLNKLTGTTNMGMKFDFSPVISSVVPREVVNEFAHFTNFPPTLQLSKYFNLGDLTTRVGEASYQNKLLPQGNLKASDIAVNLKALSVNVLDPIREKYPNTQIMTGFVQGDTSHAFGQGLGTNLQFYGATDTQYFEYAKWIKENVAFDQMILHYKTTGDEHPWIHLSFNPDGNRDHTSTDKVMTYMNNVKAIDGLVDLASFGA